MTKLNYLRMISVGGSKGGGQVSGHYWTTDDLLRYFKSRNRRHRAAPDYNKSNELSFYVCMYIYIYIYIYLMDSYNKWKRSKKIK